MFDGTFYDRAIWYCKFAWLPKRSYISNKRIWLEKGYKGTRLIAGPGEPVIDHKWLTKDEYLFARLRGKI